MIKLKRITVVSVLLFLVQYSYSQNSVQLQNLRTFDEKKFHFGFSLGYNNSSYKLKNNYSNSELHILEVENLPGFDIGLVSVYHISKNIKLRFTPYISFQDKQVEYHFFQGKDKPLLIDNQRIESTLIEFPLVLKLRTNRIGDFASAVLLGGKYGIDAASQKEKEDAGKPFLKTENIDYGIIIGAGFDFFLQYFKFGVEIKYNHGLNNMLFKENSIYANPLDYMRSRVWTFTITFEG
jgi:hypothetical protein